MAEDAAVRQLQRLDCEIAQVVAKSRHVALYTLKYDSSGREIWEREKMEGSMFLVRRRLEPYYAVCVLNRLTTTDLCQLLKFGTGDFEVEFPAGKANFLIYRNQGNIKAIWFAEEEEQGGGFQEVKAAVERAEREALSTPPIPKYVSRPVGPDGEEPILSMPEMRDALFRLLGNDKFMHTLHAQYVAAEQRRRQQPPPHQMMHPPHLHFVHHPQQHPGQQMPPMQGLIPPSSPLDQQQLPRQGQQQPPGYIPPYQLPPPPWNGPQTPGTGPGPAGIPYGMAAPPGVRPGPYPNQYQKQ